MAEVKNSCSIFYSTKIYFNVITFVEIINSHGRLLGNNKIGMVVVRKNEFCCVLYLFIFGPQPIVYFSTLTCWGSDPVTLEQWHYWRTCKPIENN